MLAIYVFCLVLGGGFLALSVFGDFLETDVGDLDVDVDAEVAFDSGPGSGGGAASKIFSIRSIVYGLFGFGGVGALMSWLNPAGSAMTAAAFAVAGGLGSGALISSLFGWLKRSDSGARSRESSFIGVEGRVTIPMSGHLPGQVTVTRSGRSYVLRALPHPTRKPDDDPSVWDTVVVLEMDQGIALVVPNDELLLGP